MAVPSDLFEAIIQHLLASQPLVAAFGDDPSTLRTTKIWADQSQPGVDLPRASYEDSEEVRTPMSRDQFGLVNTVCRGQFTFHVTAAEKLQARQLADEIARLLDDAPLAFADGVLLELTPTKSDSVDVTDPQSNGAIIAYARTVSFVYIVQRNA